MLTKILNWFKKPEDKIPMLLYKGKEYDPRFYRIVYLDDSPPMYDMGSDYVWTPDTMLEKKEWWEPTYGTPFLKVSYMPKEMQDKIRRCR
jgi:hypothetical protein